MDVRTSGSHNAVSAHMPLVECAERHIHLLKQLNENLARFAVGIERNVNSVAVVQSNLVVVLALTVCAGWQVTPRQSVKRRVDVFELRQAELVCVISDVLRPPALGPAWVR